MQRNAYPFTAVVGQQSMKTALLCCAVDPTIGGVLIRGQKGTGKSTAARALGTLLPEIEAVADCPFSCSPDEGPRSRPPDRPGRSPRYYGRGPRPPG